jgi:hypothetical protein
MRGELDVFYTLRISKDVYLDAAKGTLLSEWSGIMGRFGISGEYRSSQPQLQESFDDNFEI